MSAKRLGIMGGTFDPIHYGHLVAAEMARTEFNLEKVLFIPTGTPPHKERNVTSAAVRYDMVKKSIEDNPFFEISDYEILKQGPSYTVETLRYLNREYPNHELYFITGTDALREILTWREVEEILTLTEFIGASRPGFDASDFLGEIQQKHSDIRGKFHSLEVPALAISSTDIRERIENGKSIRYLLPEPVRLLIGKLNLYQKGL